MTRDAVPVAWHLTDVEQFTLLRVVLDTRVSPPALHGALREAELIFGGDPGP